MKAVLLVGGFSTQMRPLSLTLPLPLIDFCNQPLLAHQLQALKDAGISEVIISFYERSVPPSWDESVKKLEASLGLSIKLNKEERAAGTAGAIKHAEALITDGGSNDSPFIVVNADVLCSYPLRDLLHLHIKHGREATVLTTRTERPSEYGVVVIDEKTGRVRHFVDRPETFVSDHINGGVYAFSPSIFKRIPSGEKYSMNVLLPDLAHDEQLHSMLLTGYWVKLTTASSFMDAVRAHLAINRFLSPTLLTSSTDDYTVKGDVMVHPTAKVGRGCMLGPSVVIGPNCLIEDGVRLEGVTLMTDVRVQSHAIVKDSMIGWSSSIGKWCHVVSSVFGEDVVVKDALLINNATVLPHKEIENSVREAEILI